MGLHGLGDRRFGRVATRALQGAEQHSSLKLTWVGLRPGGMQRCGLTGSGSHEDECGGCMPRKEARDSSKKPVDWKNKKPSD